MDISHIQWLTNKLRITFSILILLLTTHLVAGTTITILETSDLHGFIHDWDFYSNSQYDQGLAMVETIVREERMSDPDLLLLDGGDTFQGTPLLYYYNIIKPDSPNPMAIAMNAMNYDAMTIGNHDYNYGQIVLDKIIGELNFPAMSANIRDDQLDEKYTPYLIKTVKGVKVGILSLTTTGIPVWENPANIGGLQFNDAVETAIEYVPRMKAEGAEVIIALAHSGTHLEPENSRDAQSWMTPVSQWVDKGYADVPDQNFVIKLAESVPEIDVIMAGHAHSTIPQSFINGVLVVEPSYWGRGICKVTIMYDGDKVTSKQGEFISVKGKTADVDIIQLTDEYQSTAVNYINSPAGYATMAFDGGDQARIQDTPLVDFLNTIQLEMASRAGYPAQIALAAVFNNSGGFEEGTITIADVYKIYQYDNTLYVLEITGDILRRALEHNAQYWNQLELQEPNDVTIESLKSGNTRDYNWDMYSGVDYVLDLTKPIGQRVVYLELEGQPIKPDQKLVLAINNYRAGGGGGYSMFKEGKILWQSQSVIRDFMVDYIYETQILDPDDYYNENWHLIPEWMQDLPK
ncbi:MAG: 5'-nucleotidase C-terminal domain-containing protein [Candidatus Marinimicrobia bacterium]|nr:5'-nucleotidase C-terminal domain-containing protein [Candidatus Neomarinimicrobiota bacterium]